MDARERWHPPACHTARASGETDGARQTCAPRPTATGPGHSHARCGAWPARARCGEFEGHADGKSGSTRSHNASGSSATAIRVHATSPTRIRFRRFCYALLGFDCHPVQIAMDLDVGVEKLDRDVPAKFRVTSPIDFANSAAAEPRHDFVDADASTGLQRHSQRRPFVRPPMNARASLSAGRPGVSPRSQIFTNCW